MKDDRNLRERLVAHIEGGEAFLNIEHVLDRIPFERTAERVADLPYSFYEQFYHLYAAQKDLLEYSKDSYHESPVWPEGYWPSRTGPANEEEWTELQEAYFKDRSAFQEMLKDPERDLTEPFKNGSGHTLFRQALLVIEHAAYHTGQLWVIMRCMGLHG
jgi:uncharacterized damage-inducible protein DinB